MSEKQTQTTATGQIHENYDLSFVHEDRRYVSKKETLGYILHHWSSGFNINKYKNRYIYDVLLIDFSWLAIMESVGGVWDVINDTLIGALVDKTRTRWGKFRPYLIGFSVPMAFISCFYWFLPFIFPETGANHLPKVISLFAFNIITETAGTFAAISSTGLLSTITPHPTERTRLITKAQVLAIGSNVPELIMGLVLDLINNEVIKWSLRGAFVGFGLFTNFAAAAAALYFFITSRERVMQSIKSPSIIQGLKSIITNKPILLITLSEFLAGFSIKTGMTDYYIDVLGSASLQTVVGIPAGPISYSSYAAVSWFRSRFSTKALWIFEDFWSDACWLGVFGLGLINNNYTKRGAMIPIMMIEECFEMMVYGLRKVIPNELYNEAMDYCEWKNGYRTEAMTGVAKGLITKLQNIVNNTVKNLLMKYIGYEQGRKVGTQDEKTKRYMFMFATGIPVITGALGVLPKFFYPLTGEKRDRMYAELMKRRADTATAVAHASKEEMDILAEAQIHNDFSELSEINMSNKGK